MNYTLKAISCWLVGLACISPAFAATSTAYDLHSLHLDWRDTTVAPMEDFYRYANGYWQKQNPIPEEYSRWGSFNIVQNKVDDQLHELLLKAAKNNAVGADSLTAQVGNFYASGMDMKLINKEGIKPLEPVLNTIRSVKKPHDLQAAIASLQKIGINAVFSFSSMQDFKDSKKMTGVAYQGGLGLPDRDYYLKQDEKFAKIREAYVNHISRLFTLLGDNETRAQARAKRVMHIETELAQASMSQVAQRDPHAVYHIMDLKQLDTLTPGFSWKRYFVSMGQPGLHQINMAMPEFFKSAAKLLQTVSVEDWKSYLTLRLVDDYAPYLSKPFVEENFHMVSVITGQKKQQPRWKQVVHTENSLLGFAVGKLYVENYFPPASKQEVTAMLKNIRQALAEDLTTLAWMTPATRQKALAKLKKMGSRVGYPEQWRSYAGLTVNRGPYVLNVARANAFLVRYELNKINKPVDPHEWAMPPQTVNAYYDPSMNRINLPAGILQPPFFDPKAPPAVNYGAIGFVIGHEITHGFDDQGAKFDGQGNLTNWWSTSDLKQFKKATQCIATQYSGYQVADGLHLQGDLVVGEATADLGGLTLAYRAFERSPEFKTAPTLGSLSPSQQFFLSTAHVWAMNIRPEHARLAATTDPHPPAKYRVNGTLANMDTFSKAFSISSQSVMKNKTRCEIW